MQKIVSLFQSNFLRIETDDQLLSDQSWSVIKSFLVRQTSQGLAYGSVAVVCFKIKGRGSRIKPETGISVEILNNAAP